jgi:ABC-type antimicrobial peptide transport system permease subunit
MEMPSFLLALDPYLIWFYRLPGNAYAGFFLGTFVLALICLILGDVTFSLAARLQGKHLDSIASEASKYQDLSIDAAKAGDKNSYHAANKLANDAFGKSFFSLMALSMARLWPAPFALAWMQHRFLGVEFPIPGTNWSLGFIGVFIIVYVAAYFLLKRVKRLLSFPGMKAMSTPDPVPTPEEQVLSATTSLINSYDKKR